MQDIAPINGIDSISQIRRTCLNHFFIDVEPFLAGRVARLVDIDPLAEEVDEVEEGGGVPSAFWLDPLAEGVDEAEEGGGVPSAFWLDPFLADIL